MQPEGFLNKLTKSKMVGYTNFSDARVCETMHVLSGILVRVGTLMACCVESANSEMDG